LTDTRDNREEWRRWKLHTPTVPPPATDVTDVTADRGHTWPGSRVSELTERGGRVDAVDQTDMFEAERPRLVGIASRVLGDHAEAEDVGQQADAEIQSPSPTPSASTSPPSQRSSTPRQTGAA
jgi:hypothetical protein